MLSTRKSSEGVLSQSISFLIWRTNNQWQHKLRHILKELNLTYAEFVVLTTLTMDMKKRSYNQRYLVKQAGLDEMLVSQTLRSLEKKRLVIRTKGIIDGRAVSLRPRQIGVQRAGKAVKIIKFVDKQLLEDLTSSDLSKLLQ